MTGDRDVDDIVDDDILEDTVDTRLMETRRMRCCRLTMMLCAISCYELTSKIMITSDCRTERDASMTEYVGRRAVANSLGESS